MHTGAGHIPLCGIFNGKPGHRGPTQPALSKIPLTFETVPYRGCSSTLPINIHISHFYKGRKNPQTSHLAVQVEQIYNMKPNYAPITAPGIFSVQHHIPKLI